jgi:hypothetical protein
MATFRLFCAALAFTPLLGAAEPIQNESVRLQILAAIFPSMTVSGGAIPGRKTMPLKHGTFPPIEFPDALAGERLYYVTGEPASESEKCAAENMLESTFSQVRELQFKAFALPPTHDAVAVLQYTFSGSSPAGSCWSVGRVVRLSLQNTGWRVEQDRVLQGQHHSGLEEISVIDLDNDGFAELIVDMDEGGAGNHGSSLILYSLQEGQLEEWLRVISRSVGIYGAFAQRLDLAATRAARAQRFCFRKIEYAEADLKVLPKPRVSASCYPKYEGVERR